ncbi:MAG: EAL domain-containing protein [Lachnospiraceae bacterium]|nr:EAL domain-containing protein [Lachnospiraceae bacterium]
MANTINKFNAAAGRRQILVADDEMINREMLGMILQNEYEVIYAENGKEALELMRANRHTLSLVLLDILMPEMNGIEVLKICRADVDLVRIPVIVVTSEQSMEVESLKIGAIDFIPKPYPAPEVILARVLRTIELSEDRDIISQTERDPLTGLYNKEYFYRYAAQFDRFHTDVGTDAIMLDVNHFRTINERFGKAHGDDVLKRIAGNLREAVAEEGGMVCRRESDVFLIYCPHRKDPKELLEAASVVLMEDGESDNRVRIRMGVYSNADKNIDIERRFDRAKMAADTVKGNITKAIGFYDSEMHEKEIFAEQLIEGFQKAVEERQFQVFYQPKFDVRPDTPILASAEALVRWIHPELGMISPGVFIPLFEKSGLIVELDTYVWRETARQIRDWKDRLGYSVPVSVNVSRIDMHDPDLIQTFGTILGDFGLTSSDLLLEVTESAYTDGTEQIIEKVHELRKMGFRIEMDDFGTGYSSLNMLSKLPLDALKLDMEFVRSAFRPGGSTRMVEVILEIADYLHVPVIAEGVETEAQLNTLKTLSCDFVQGYFFSKPVPAKDFEPFILQRKETDKAEKLKNVDEAVKKIGEHIVNDHRAEEEADGEEAEVQDFAPEEKPGGLHLRTANSFFMIVAIVVAASLFISDLFVAKGYRNMEDASDRYIAAQFAASNMESGSDYLTDRVRCFVVTGEVEYLDDFFEEVEVTRTRDRAVADLEELLGGKDKEAIGSLNAALQLSNELVDIEYRAMKLTLAAGDYRETDVPPAIEAVELTPEETALTPEEKKLRAQDMVFGNNYMHSKDRIRENVNECTQALIRNSRQELEAASARMSVFTNIQTMLTVVFLLTVLTMVIFINKQIRRPLTKMVELMRGQKPMSPEGAEELRFVARTYNSILKENLDARDKLSHAASHDALTGLFNRGAYDMLMASVDTEHIALILVDVDYFKQVNDTYGHAVGDRVLKRVAELLKHSFRSVDVICRLGGDEFAVIMTRVNSSMSQLVINKISQINSNLQNPKDDLPPVSLSVGVAFSDRDNPQGDIFKDADSALYDVKEAGRNGCAIYKGE